MFLSCGASLEAFRLARTLRGGFRSPYFQGVLRWAAVWCGRGAILHPEDEPCTVPSYGSDHRFRPPLLGVRPNTSPAHRNPPAPETSQPPTPAEAVSVDASVQSRPANS